MSEPIEQARRQLEGALQSREQADISWIQPPPESDGWTLAADALMFVDRLVRLLRPAHVIEFGAGLSTRVIARACLQSGGQCAVSSIDHDPKYGVADTRALVESAADMRMSSQIAPLVARDYGGKLLPTYHLDPSALVTQSPADLVLIDGPPIALGGREGILYQALPYCRPGAIVLLDDASRGAERTALRNWQEVLGDAIEIRVLPDFTKGMAAIIVHKCIGPDTLWNVRCAAAIRKVRALVPANSSFVLVDSRIGDDFGEGRRAGQLVRRNGEDWGAPVDDGSALASLDVRCREGATHFIVPWTSFWWIDYYGEFFAQLRRRFACVADGDLLLAFDLRVPR